MDKNKARIIWQLFSTFFKIGAFTFGGGYAMMPLIQREVVEKHKWITDEEMLDVFAISESTPGPVAINMATFIGYNRLGVLGSFFSTFGVVLPSVIVIVLISGAYEAFRSNMWVDFAFKGVRAAVSVLLINNVIRLSARYKNNKIVLCVALAVFCLLTVFNVKAIYLIMVAIAVGIVMAKFNIKMKDSE